MTVDARLGTYTQVPKAAMLHKIDWAWEQRALVRTFDAFTTKAWADWREAWGLLEPEKKLFYMDAEKVGHQLRAQTQPLPIGNGAQTQPLPIGNVEAFSIYTQYSKHM